MTLPSVTGCVGEAHRQARNACRGPFLYSTEVIALGTVITTVGKSLITGRLADIGPVPAYLGAGTGAGSAAVTDTTLFSEMPQPRVPCAVSLVTTSTADDTYRTFGTITNAGGIVTVTNVGIFDAATGGNLLAKADSVGQVLDVNEGLTVSFNLQVVGVCP